MSASNRGFRKGSTFLDRKHADAPDNFGNRRTFEESRIPPDNVGNKIEFDPIATFIHDGLGNSQDEEPSHVKSGILTHLLGVKDRVVKRGRDAQKNFSPYQNNRIPRPVKNESFPSESRLATKDDVLAPLLQEFAKLLKEKAGLPFSFSMKPVSDQGFDEQDEIAGLLVLKTTIEDILMQSHIEAVVAMSQYRTAQHHFAVFFIHPKERDAAKNKELISALRQIINEHAPTDLSSQVNILLVLANAQMVIEAHLHKVGARKIST